MRKKIVGIIVCLLCVSAVFCDELYKDIKVVKNLPIGTKNGELDIIPFPDYSGLEGRGVGDDYFHDGPTAMAFDDSGLLYVMDQNNNRIVVYNQDFSFNKTINLTGLNENEPLVPDQMEILKTGIFFYQYYCSDTYVGVINFDGTIEWAFNISEEYGYRLNKYVYYYDEESKLFFHYLEGDTIACFPDLQKKTQGENLLVGSNKINEYFKSTNITNMFVNNKNQLVKNTNIMKFDLKTLDDYDPPYQALFQGFDINNNFIFAAEKKSFVVFDKDTNFLLTIFYDLSEQKRLGRTAYPSLHPSGDVYWLEYSYAENKIELKRVKNVWDPVGRAKWYAQQGKVKSGTINDTDVTVRFEPNLEGAKLTHLQPNTKVTVLGQSAEKMQIGSMNNYWYHLELEDGTVGWVYGAFVDIE